MKAPELLLPAGTLDKMRTAYAFGADAVYAGQPRYSLRARNNEFQLEQLDLGIKEDFFVSRLDRPMSTLRLLHYPPGDSSDLGAGMHTDYGNLTVLATDGVAGLQVRRRDGRWLDAPHVAGAFVCNIGDCLMR